ncbi:hypothetical protein [Janthinobacterium sp. RB2P8]|jgi:hypothetical protein|uniref:hypothetical protein n=1 Tax=Janthinobacterium sp. RB2P8 TaxID=3424191 RepID=UPI003F26BC20
MATINVLVAVNVGQAVAQSNLSKYVFMVDTTGYSCNGNEGGNELVTSCKNGDTIVWNVTSLDPAEQVSIHSFGGTAINNGMVNPAPYPQYDNTVWGGRVNAKGSNVQYTMTLLLAGNTLLTFDPFIVASNPQ